MESEKKTFRSKSYENFLSTYRKNFQMKSKSETIAINIADFLPTFSLLLNSLFWPFSHSPKSTLLRRQSRIELTIPTRGSSKWPIFLKISFKNVQFLNYIFFLILSIEKPLLQYGRFPSKYTFFSNFYSFSHSISVLIWNFDKIYMK
jgi:hypothetical protein